MRERGDREGSVCNPGGERAQRGAGTLERGADT